MVGGVIWDVFSRDTSAWSFYYIWAFRGVGGSGEPGWASVYAGKTGWDTFSGVDLFLVYTPRAKKFTPIG